MNIKAGLAHLRSTDSKMQRLIAEYGQPDFGKKSDYFEALIRAMVYQQLSGKAASTIYKRFLQLFPAQHYPSPEEVLRKTNEELRSVGLSNQKSSYVHNIAHAFATGTIPQNLDKLTDEEISACLTKIKGVGTWTAEMFLMFTMQRSDIFPVTDLGIRKGFQIYLQSNNLPEAQTMIKTAEKWQPYRTIASWYLWRLVEGPFEW